MDNENVLGQFLVNSFGDKYLYEINGFSFNKIGSEASYNNHFGETIFSENTLYVIVGCDSGLLPRYISKRGLPKGSYYLFIEIPAVLERVETVLSETELSKKIILTTPEEWLLSAKEIEYQNFAYLGNLNFVSSFAATDGRLSEYLQLKIHLQEELEKIRWGLNAELGAELFHLRQLENLPENRVSAVCLDHLFDGKTAIVLGGAPSLDEILPWVIKNRRNLVLIAVSRIARRLLELEITPDIIVSVDPNQLSFDISKEMLEFWQETIFINKFHTVSTLLGQWAGRSLFTGPRVPWGSSLNDNTRDSPGPTVTNSAIDLAVKMGVSQLLLAGVDLCHGRDGYTHAQGSNERLVGPQLGRGLLWVETNGGWLAETTPDLHFAATQIGAQARVAKQQGCRIVNLAEGATKIALVDYVFPEEIDLPQLSKSPLKTILEQIPVDTSTERVEHYKMVLAELTRAQNSFREIKKLAISGLKANAAFFGRRSSGKGDPKHKAKMDRIEKKLKNNFPDFNLLVKKFGIRGFLKLTQGDRDQEWDRDDVERLGRIYYEAYRDSAGRLFEIVREAAGRAEARLEEEAIQPDFQKLFEQWERDQQPGRSLVWKNRHREKQIPASAVVQFSALEDKFEKLLQQRETTHMQRARNWSDLGLVRGKLLVMFKQKQEQSLRSLVENLAVHNTVEAQSLFHLGRGYMAELGGDVDGAINEYQQIFDLQEQEQDLLILEDSLRRLLALLLQLENFSDAKIAAECLAGISVNYVPYLAELLWILGEREASLDRYADYLDQVPDDVAVMMKLGRHYLDLGVKEGAELMFLTVLEKDSDNEAAKVLLEQSL